MAEEETILSRFLRAKAAILKDSGRKELTVEEVHQGYILVLKELYGEHEFSQAEILFLAQELELELGAEVIVLNDEEEDEEEPQTKRPH